LWVAVAAVRCVWVMGSRASGRVAWLAVAVVGNRVMWWVAVSGECEGMPMDRATSR